MSCKYYGMHGHRGMLIPQLGNECGAIHGAYAPCLMETAGLAPEEAACEIAAQENAIPARQRGPSPLLLTIRDL